MNREQPQVRPGQVWADNDKRGEGRFVKVVAIEPAQPGDPHTRPVPARALVVQTDRFGRVVGKEKRTRIRLDRFRPTAAGYRLVLDVEDGTR